jgi:flavin-dependent dehydrogenase
MNITNIYIQNIDADDKKGAFLPNGEDILLETNACIKFVGDAAGLISPITGEGIYYAIASAKTLSKDFTTYKANMAKIVRQIKKENIYKHFIYHPTIRTFIFNRYHNKIYKKLIEKVLDSITNKQLIS